MATLRIDRRPRLPIPPTLATGVAQLFWVIAIGLDTASLDIGPSTDYPVHVAWLPGGRYGIENLANLEQVPPAGAMLFVGAPTFQGGSGGPARVLALV